VANREPCPHRAADPLKNLKVMTEYGGSPDFGQPVAREVAINDRSHLRVRPHDRSTRPEIQVHLRARRNI
jgi:hypothetical protein